MTRLLERYLKPVRNADGVGAGGGDGEGAGEGGDAGGDKSPESVLFPDEGNKGDAGEDGTGDDADGGDKPGEGGSEWKEYEPDPNKSDEENARLKAEHDKAKPKEGDDKGKKSDDPADQVPEDGKYELAMPEGIPVDQEMVDALGPEFAELGLTNAQAQKLADKFIEVQKGKMEARGKEWGDRVSGWVDDAKNDKEMGGDNWDTTVSNGRRFLDAHGTPELRDYLNASGGGNHPEIIRVFAKAGALIREDNPADGGAGGSGKPAEAAHVLFPNDAPKG